MASSASNKDDIPLRMKKKLTGSLNDCFDNKKYAKDKEFSRSLPELSMREKELDTQELNDFFAILRLKLELANLAVALKQCCCKKHLPKKGGKGGKGGQGGKKSKR